MPRDQNSDGPRTGPNALAGASQPAVPLLIAVKDGTARGIDAGKPRCCGHPPRGPLNMDS